MKQHYYLFILFLLWSQLIQAQTLYNKTPQYLKGNSIWALPEYAGLDFNSGTAAPTISAMPTRVNGEGAASVCNRNTGDLLFYTNGETIWNANHQPMLNGDTLFGNGAGFNIVDDFSGRPDYDGPTTRQGALIVPFIEDSNKYYVFSLAGVGTHMMYFIDTQTTNLAPATFWVNTNGDTIRGALFYSVVDMALDNGLGGVIPNQKNLLLDSAELSEAMIAIPGECGSIWLLVHTLAPKAWETLDSTTPTPKYKAYEITASGINPIPVISNGKMHCSQGTMCVSSDRSIIAMNGGGVQPWVHAKGTGLEIAKFNVRTGEVSNPIIIEDYASPSIGQQNSNPMGSSLCALSPDGKKLYYDFEAYTTAGYFNSLMQCDISSFDSSVIAATRMSIAGSLQPSSDPLLTFRVSMARLYKDTIYLTSINNGNSGTTYISRINNPNGSGVNCDLDVDVLPSIPGTHFAGLTLGSETVFNNTSDTLIHSQEERICKEWADGIQLSPSHANGIYFSWSDSSKDSILTINQAGTYWVSYYTEDCSFFYSDTFHVTGADLPEPVIRVNEMELSTALSYHTYQWLYNGELLQGETDSVLYVEVNGDYQVIVTNEEGCVDTSDVYPVNNADLQRFKGLAAQIYVWPNPVQDEVFVRSPIPVKLSLTSISGKRLQQQLTSNTLSMRELAEGMYLLRITDKNGNLIKVEKLIKAEY